MQEKLEINLVREKLLEINQLSAPPKTGKEIFQIADLWLEDLGWMRPDMFVLAIKRFRTRRDHPFFPIPFEIKAHYTAVQIEARVSEQAQLPMPAGVSGQQAKLNREGVKAIRDAMAKAHSMPQKGDKQ